MCRGVQFLLFLFIATLGDEYSRAVIRGSENMLSSGKKTCIIPDNTEYHYVTSEGDRLTTGDSIDGNGEFVVSVECFNFRKVIKPTDFAVCFDGKLYPGQHTCEKQCAPKYDSYSTIFSCTTPKGDEVSCQLPAEPGTKLTIRCAHWRYKSPSIDMLGEKLCLQNGEWEEYKDCAPQCGLRSENDGLSSHTNKFKVGHWRAVIFVYKKKRWTFLCRAAVISNVLVITALTCFGKFTSKRAFPLKVGVGKYSTNYGDYLSTNIYDVEKIYSSKLQHSITIVGVDTYIEFSDTVGNICIGDTPILAKVLEMCFISMIRPPILIGWKVY
ncbi:uncharacterized protein LOC120350880 [Nilaparvata lugens]|uniref:uncharacterized protein LOC120350880 n=1 Tax=Nilaparvata lugens TaxID=108931 RepID=UPI00193D7B8D|nr:uncharacterized protein LOC120350880 [Nilaparvata lugens]